MEDKEGLGYISEIFTQSRDSIPDDMHVTEENKDTIKAELMNFYTSGGNYVDNPRKLVTLMSDHDFVKSVLKFAEQLVKHSQNPYLYQFSYKGVLGFHRNQSACGWRGSSLIQHH
ncbi:unnamed protein product [Acanthoscelides obtectus]|nr:unnamed protein product [Acanthoscelides obtectus]CAH2020445.1 unnamed protein product [Acanthoscelides obtectus]CAH2020860.1 unnamed protein product [Acanthoscelides obtectus]CAH2021288.1 unnamed protein product [Acanthoscelides obtectus]CAK1683580.1 hypothetical protein AOBTE_LOCUS34335 [Acanthoscelides obtectus]